MLKTANAINFIILNFYSFWTIEEIIKKDLTAWLWDFQTSKIVDNCLWKTETHLNHRLFHTFNRVFHQIGAYYQIYSFFIFGKVFIHFFAFMKTWGFFSLINRRITDGTYFRNKTFEIHSKFSTMNYCWYNRIICGYQTLIKIFV